MDNVQIKLIRTLKINFSINTEIQTRALLTGEKMRERVDIMCLPKKKGGYSSRQPGIKSTNKHKRKQEKIKQEQNTGRNKIYVALT